MYPVKQVPPDAMTPDQRKEELAGLLANALARLRADTRPLPASTAIQRESLLAISGGSRVHSNPVNT